MINSILFIFFLSNLLKMGIGNKVLKDNIVSTSIIHSHQSLFESNLPMQESIPSQIFHVLSLRGGATGIFIDKFFSFLNKLFALFFGKKQTVQKKISTSSKPGKSNKKVSKPLSTPSTSKTQSGVSRLQRVSFIVFYYISKLLQQNKFIIRKCKIF
jgi:hypothetical protein